MLEKGVRARLDDGRTTARHNYRAQASAAVSFIAGLMACRNAATARQVICTPQAAKSLVPETAAVFLAQTQLRHDSNAP